ncbi:MAG: rRNA maturation RNase YbeY [Omnitrophica WOR_2 bacterium]|jgi:rRNA maturation RNase YbeY
MSINFFSEDIAFELENKQTIIRWINQVIEDHKSSLGTINYIFCNDEYLLRLNKQYLDHDTYTDIITFDYSTPKVLSGEIYISIDRVEENSIKFKSTFLNELHRVIIHGILHLTGQGDKTEKESKIMRSKEDHYLNLIDSK